MVSPFANDRINRFTAFLAHQRTCIISTTASHGVWAIPVWYRSVLRNSRNPTLEINCLVPRWSDVAHHLTQVPKVVLIIQTTSGAGLCWLQVQGMAREVEIPDWTRLLPRWASKVQPDSLYQVVRVTPGRIDLIDDELGWGIQETLEW